MTFSDTPYLATDFHTMAEYLHYRKNTGAQGGQFNTYNQIKGFHLIQQRVWFVLPAIKCNMFTVAEGLDLSLLVFD